MHAALPTTRDLRPLQRTRPGPLGPAPVRRRSGAFDPLKLPGMRFLAHTDDVVAGGSGNLYAASLPNRKAAQTFTRGGTDTSKFLVDTFLKPGHKTVYRQGIGSSQNLQYSGADLGGLFQGSISFTLGCYCLGFVDTAPGTNGILSIGSSGNVYAMLSPSNVATSGMRLSVAGTGTAGGATAGASSADATYTRDANVWHLVAASLDISTLRVTHTVDGVVKGVSPPIALREAIGMGFVCLGATSNTNAVNEMAFGGWFGATSIYGTSTLAQFKTWFDTSFAPPAEG